MIRAMFAPRTAIALTLAACAMATAGCGDNGQQVDTPGATLFAERCAGCHTLEAAGTEGSNPEERVAGPNLNNRRETKDQVLYAIRNGGFSGAIMPQNVVVGAEAQAVADFVSKYAGKSAKGPPGLTPDTGATGQSGSTGSSGKSKSSSDK